MKKLAIIAIGFLLITQAHAQNKTIVKTNLFGLGLRNYTFELERTLSRKVSIGASYRNMPSGSLPMVDRIISFSDVTDPDTENALRTAQMGGNAINVEARLYLSKKGYGRGFYLGAYYRKTTFDLDLLPISVGSGTSARSIRTEGKFDISGGGLLLGVHFKLSNRLGLDWQMLGIGAGNASLTIDAQPNPPLTATEQNDMRTSLQDFSVPGVTVTTNVTATSVKATGSGTMPWVRTGLALSFRF